MAGQSGPGTAQPHHGRHQPLPLPGRSHPGPLASRITPPRRPTWDLRRARCGESRPAGSGSGPRKRTRRKTGTAPRTDFTTPTARTDHSISARPRAALRRVPGRPSGRCGEIGSVVSSTNTCRSPEVTGFSALTRTTTGRHPARGRRSARPAVMRSPGRRDGRCPRPWSAATGIRRGPASRRACRRRPPAQPRRCPRGRRTGRTWPDRSTPMRRRLGAARSCAR
jgi:hypothetical protein